LPLDSAAPPIQAFEGRGFRFDEINTPLDYMNLLTRTSKSSP